VRLRQDLAQDSMASIFRYQHQSIPHISLRPATKRIARALGLRARPREAFWSATSCLVQGQGGSRNQRPKTRGSKA
jgi:hypothetical protein